MGLRHSHRLACPQCDQDHDLVIGMWGWYHLTNQTDDEMDAEIYEADTNDGPYNWDDQSQARCWTCGWAGTVKDATV
jgi:hypothetical protein